MIVFVPSYKFAEVWIECFLILPTLKFANFEKQEFLFYLTLQSSIQEMRNSSLSETPATISFLNSSFPLKTLPIGTFCFV